MTGKTELYRHYNKAGELLYVGISFRSAYRMAVHAHSSPWWDEVESITIERLPDRAAAIEAERIAIQQEKPRYNKDWVERPYKTPWNHGLTIDLPGAPEMAPAVVDWYISITRKNSMPKALKGLADKFDQSTEAGRAYAAVISALEDLHSSEELLPNEPKLTPEQVKAGMDAARKRGWSPGPDTLIERLEKEDPAKLKALRKDVADPAMTWRGLHKKYGYAVATLRRHFEDDRKAALLKLAAKDEKE